VTNKLIRPVTKQHIAGVTAIPPTPARCYTQTITRTTSGSVGTTSTFVSIDVAAGGGTSFGGFATPVYRAVPSYIGDFGQLVTQELVGWNILRFAPANPVYTTTTETTCTPAVAGREGVAAQIIEQNAGPDWRASSRSIERRTGDVTAAFDVSNSPRILIGLSVRDTGANQSDVRMGVAFVTAGQTTQIIPINSGVQQAAVGTFTNGDRVALSRVGDKFFIQSGNDLVYSATASTLEPVYLDALLFTSNDSVDNPEFSTPLAVSVSGRFGFTAGLTARTGVSASLGFAGVVGTLVDGTALVSVAGQLGFTGAVLTANGQEVSASGQVGFTGALRTGVVFLDGSSGGDETFNSGLTTSAITIGPLATFAANKPYAAGATVLSPIAVEGRTGEVSQTVDGADIVLAPPVSYATMQTGGLITGQLVLRGLRSLAADRPYAGATMTLPALLVYGDDGFGDPNYYGHNEGLELSAPMYTDPSLFASIYETLELGIEMSLATLVSGTIFEGLILDPSISAADFLSALIESGINLSSATQMPDPSVAQYAFNSLTGAATRYSDFGFTQFTRVGGATYAIKPDGLYRLRTGDDDGLPRSALADFGTMAFGAQQRKNIETMYLGMTTDGTVYAKLKADGGNEKIYHVIQREPTMRVRTGKGLTAREWSLKLEVVDATRVDLDTVDFVVGASVRRWTR
jgi:hypothetical protein